MDGRWPLNAGAEEMNQESGRHQNKWQAPDMTRRSPFPPGRPGRGGGCSPPHALSGQLWSTWDSAYLPMVVNAHEGQGGPGQLHGLEVDGGARGPRALDCWLIHGARSCGAEEDGHGLQGQPVHDVDATVMEGQGQP